MSTRTNASGAPRHEPRRLLIGSRLGELERRKPNTTARQRAAALGIREGTYNSIRSNKRQPTFEQLAAIAGYFDEPIENLLTDLTPFRTVRDGLEWHRRAGLDATETVIRDATHLALQGKSPAEILADVGDRAKVLVGIGSSLVLPVRAGIGLGMVQLHVSPTGWEIQDVALADRLASALSTRVGRGVQVHVARNFAHAEFERDPIVPFLIAHLAHRVVGGFFRDNPQASTFGLAGGIHLASFVSLVGVDSSPFPDGDNRHFTLVPLTFEPLSKHHLHLADGLVAELHARAAMLLGEHRVPAESCRPYGYLVDGQIGEIDTGPIAFTRTKYAELDVAVFGCGDESIDGWMGWAERLGSRGFTPKPPTDCCLNPISRDGVPMDLPATAGRRCQHLGAGIEHIRAVAKPGKLALLLASGQVKGEPITLVARAGLTNSIICDQAAAEAALAILEGTASGRKDE